MPPTKTHYESLLKRNEGLRDVFNRWRAHEEPSDDAWRNVIWPATVLDVVLGDDGHIDPNANTQDRAVRNWHAFVLGNEQKLHAEIYSHLLEPGRFAFVPFCYEAALLVLDLLGDASYELVYRGLCYHDVHAPQAGPTVPYG